MHLHYLVNFTIRVFVKILMLEKQNSRNFTYLQLLLGFTKMNMSDHKLAKYYFNILAKLNKYGNQCRASSLSELQALFR